MDAGGIIGTTAEIC